MLTELAHILGYFFPRVKKEYLEAYLNDVLKEDIVNGLNGFERRVDFSTIDNYFRKVAIRIMKKYPIASQDLLQFDALEVAKSILVSENLDIQDWLIARIVDKQEAFQSFENAYFVSLTDLAMLLTEKA